MAVHEPLDAIRHGDVVQLVHGMTHRALNSHDVAAPTTPHCQVKNLFIIEFALRIDKTRSRIAFRLKTASLFITGGNVLH